MVQKTLISELFSFSTLGMNFTDIALHVISYDILVARMHRKQASLQTSSRDSCCSRAADEQGCKNGQLGKV